MNELTTLYSDILKSVGAEIDVDNLIKYRGDNITIKMGKRDKKLILPTSEALKSGGWTELIGFHPACESIVAGQSEVLNTLVALAAFKIHETTQCLVADIINLSLNKEAHGKLTLSQSEMLKKFESIDKASEKAFLEISKRNTGISGKHPLLSIKLDRGGEINDIKYNRTCTLIKHVLNHKDSFCGYVPTTDKSKRVVRSVYEYVLPTDNRFGSNSASCPYLLSFLECYYHVSTHLNGIRKILGKYSVVPSIALNWYETINNISKLAKRYLPQSLEGNTGVLLSDKKPVVQEEQSTVAIPEVSTVVVKEDHEDKPKTNKLGLTVGTGGPTSAWGIPPVTSIPAPVAQTMPFIPAVAPVPAPSPYGQYVPQQPVAGNMNSLGAAIVATSTPQHAPTGYGNQYGPNDRGMSRQFGQSMQPQYPNYQQRYR